MHTLYTKTAVYALAAPGTSTDLITPFTPKEGASVLRITVALGTSGVLYLRTTDGTTVYNLSLNGGTALTADALYTFTVGCRNSLTYTLRLGTDGVVKYLMVEEVGGGVI